MISENYEIAFKAIFEMTELPENFDRSFIHEEYYDAWICGKCDELPFPLAIAHYDTCAKQGVYKAFKFLQQVVGILRVEDNDGFLGPSTFERIQAANISDVIKSLAIVRKRYIKSIVAKNPLLQQACEQWIKHVDDISQTALAHV